MAIWTEYTTKNVPEDEDTLMIYDSSGGENKQLPVSGMSEKIVNDALQKELDIETENKTIPSAVNELHGDIGELKSDISKHLCDNVLRITAQAQTVNGITFTVDGTKVSAVGTATDDGARFNLCGYDYRTPEELGIKRDTDYVLSGCPQGGRYGKYKLVIDGTVNTYDDYGNGYVFNVPSDSAEKFRFDIVIYAGNTVNLVFEPRCEIKVLENTLDELKNDIENSVVKLETPIFEKHMSGTATWNESTGFDDWQMNHKYLFYFDNSVGLANKPIGFLKQNGTWDIIFERHVLTSGVYAYGSPTDTSYGNITVNLDNINAYGFNLRIYDITGYDITDNDVEYLVNNASKTDLYLKKTIENSVGSTKSKWYGKNALVIGDSITAAGLWQTKLNTMLGMDITTHAKGGVGLLAMVDGELGLDGDYENAIGWTLEPLTTADVSNKDLIILLGGYNNRGTADGAIGDCYATDGSGQSTIAGYVQYCLNRIWDELEKANNLTCRIMVVTPHCAGKYGWIDADGYTDYGGVGRSMKSMSEIIEAVANHNNVPCYNAWKYSGIGRHTWSVWSASPTPTNTDGSGEGAYPYNNDQLHLNADGYYHLGECIASFVLSN